MTIVMGIDIGQRSEPTGLCVAEAQTRETGGQTSPIWNDSQTGTSIRRPLGEPLRVYREEIAEQSEVHHIVRHLERLPIGTPFPEIARRAAEVSAGIEHRAGYGPEVFVDATGLGQPVIDLLDEAMPRVRAISAVFFTHGDRRIETRTGLTTEVQLGKAHLVCRLQTLLQTARLHLPRTPEAETLAQELLEYEIRVESDANERYGAFPVGTHDELVTALGLAVQRDPVGPGIF